MRKEHMWAIGIGMGCLALIAGIVGFRHHAEHGTVEEVKSEPAHVVVPELKKEDHKPEVPVVGQMPAAEHKSAVATVPQAPSVVVTAPVAEHSVAVSEEEKKKLDKFEKVHSHKMHALELSLEHAQKKVAKQQEKVDFAMKAMKNENDTFEKERANKLQNIEEKKKTVSLKEVSKLEKELARFEKKHALKMKRFEKRLSKEQEKLKKYQVKTSEAEKALTGEKGNFVIHQH